MAWVFNPFTGTFDVTGTGSGSGTVTGTGTGTEVAFWTPVGAGATAITSDSKLFWDNTNKRLRLGGTAAGGSGRLQVEGATQIQSTIANFLVPVSAGAQPSNFFGAARGIFGGETAVQSGDLLGSYEWDAHDGSNYVQTMKLQVVAEETFNAGTSQRGSHLSILATPPAGGGLGDIKERIRIGATALGGGVIDSAGYLAIGDNSATTKFNKFISRTLLTDLTYTLPASLTAGGVLTDVAGTGTLSWTVPTGTSGTGAMGPPGMVGDDGEDGFSIPGLQGIRGLQGFQGQPGEPGEDGDEGMRGPIGLQGIPGMQGLMGPPGMDGDDADINSFVGMSRPFNHHSDLFNFVNNDDHTQYLLLSGRTGATNDPKLTTSAAEGTLFGSSVTAGSLVLRANAVDQTTGLIHLRGFSSLFSSYPTMAGAAIQSVAVFNPTTTISGTTGMTGGTTRVLDISPTFTHSTRHSFYGVYAAGTFTQNVGAQQSSFLLFAGQPTLAAGTQPPMGATIFYGAPTHAIGTGIVTSGSSALTSTVLAGAAATTVSGSSTVREHSTVGVQDFPMYTIGAGSFLKELRQAVIVGDPIVSNTGTFRLTDNVGMDVSTMTAGDANISVRSMGASVEARHRGPIVSTSAWSYLKLAALPTPSATPIITVNGTAGAITWSYQVTAVTPNGETPVSPTGTTTTGNATLTASNFNRVQWAAVPGATSYNIYRTAAGGTPATTGKIGAYDIYANSPLGVPQQQFDDTGLAGSGTAPTTNTTGLVDLQVAQKIKRTATAVSYTTLQSDYLIGVTSTAAARTITLVPAATAGAGFVQIVKDESGAAGTNNITIDGNASENIDGAATKAINTNYGAMAFYSDGANWFTIAKWGTT